MLHCLKGAWIMMQCFKKGLGKLYVVLIRDLENDTLFLKRDLENDTFFLKRGLDNYTLL